MSKTSLGIFVTGFKTKQKPRHPITMYDADYDYILDEVQSREKIEFESNVIGNSDEEQY